MKKILIADDDGMLRNYLKRDLSSEGYDVIEARTGKELLERFRNERPDMIITDLEMPEVNGEEAIAIIRHEDEKIKIIVLTCHEEKHLIDKLLQSVDDYLLKGPEKPEHILERIKAVLSEIPLDMPQYLVKRIVKDDGEKLTATEIKLIRYLKLGIIKPKEIAEKEFRSVHTIKKEFANLRNKLGTKNLTQAALRIYC
jgi:DNA-binding NarL/FixJ family response regulator